MQWMLQNKRALVTDHFANYFLYDDHGVADKDSIKYSLSSASANPPIDFDRIIARDFLSWIFSMRKGTAISFFLFRKMLPIDLGSGNLRERISDLNFLIFKIE
ncbi:hypothetical protein PHMEG_00010574 [Phytophthora megakarya]|uniref:Uncharacterized protein n=1 Tax=Phytophthora megakarya TaxID=4795 RepID=A0A225WFD3_9STRA|nr:hypothetical protein PHMEG_00010574 [Phytophthora megakarya]